MSASPAPGSAGAPAVDAGAASAGGPMTGTVADPVTVPVIAIDGPTASGKGTVAQRVARALGWHYLDSGALYRLVALAAIRTRGPDGAALADGALAGGAPTDAALASVEALAELAGGLPAVFTVDRILLDGADVTDAIREEPVGVAASRIAVMPAVREALVERQRSFRQAPGLVADGRDMGTVIFPDACLKVFLTASAEARAKRRLKQLIEKGFSAKLSDLSRDLEERDRRDATRAVAPLVPAADAFVLDSTPLDADQAVARVLEFWRRCESRRRLR